MHLIRKLFLHCETYWSNNLIYILNDFYIVRLCSKIEHNRNLTPFVLVRLHCISISELIEPSRLIKFDWV